ncbi:MAG: hypothetical protein HYW06_03095 [Gemmatimonadetes bacterium]|nr:hypothetical protein [Gemmatimonadota bacterium]MBI2401284.1 hypothetical protein [Gemmatimonadota bacterium]MBI2535958.1 hypothetical protein [Gemmatimonadota bacterium]MBI2615387.1 hypothetical protein [Gemmatimonadota bacterium]
MRATPFIHLGAAALLLCACGLVGGGGGAEDEPLPEPILTLHVENQNFYDATLYAVSRGGERLRLGVVGGNNQETFTFRWLLDELRVLISLLAGGSTVTESILVSRGDSLNLIIQPDLHLKIPDAP